QSRVTSGEIEALAWPTGWDRTRWHPNRHATFGNRTRHDSPRPYDAASADGDTVQNPHARAQPDIVLDDDALTRHASLVQRSGGTEVVVCRDDDCMRCNADPVADARPSITVDDRERIQGTVIAHAHAA